MFQQVNIFVMIKWLKDFSKSVELINCYDIPNKNLKHFYRTFFASEKQSS